MKKILIYKSISSLEPKGGPAGYLYNLNISLVKLGYNVDFLPEKSEEENKKIKRYLPKRAIQLARAIKYIKMIDKKDNVDDKYLQYDVIHFHQTTDMYNCRDFLENYKGIVVLTSHSPCVYYKELLNKINEKDYKRFKEKLDKLETIDLYAFKRANYIIFPCKEAEEPYFNSWEKYKEIRDESKIRYLYTGINECIAKTDKRIIRNRYNLSESDFVICYVGRHNKIKGYDDLLKIGKKAIEKNEVKFLIAGKNEPIVGPNNENWVEVGWTDDPHSIIKASDMFILPNKETFFDLIMLEVLSLGKIILTTYTGGNKIFEKFDNAGIFYYKDEAECLEKIKYIKSLNKEEIERYEKKNKKIFQENFTSEIFAKNYIDIINNLN